MMGFCQNCGHELTEGVKFCPSCGQSVVVANATQQQPETSNEQSANSTTVSQNRSDSKQTTADNNQPQLGFIGSVQYTLQHAFEFNGNEPESRKSIFWWSYLAYVIANLIISCIPVVGPIVGYFGLLLLTSAVMRRLAYIGKNPGIGWLLIIPIAGIYPFILMFMDGKVEQQ